MSIRLQNVVPRFLETDKISASEIWGNDHEFKQGEKIQIVAPSGSGKTSLIHFLYGLRRDYSGQVLINQTDIKSALPPMLSGIRAKVLSMIFQDLRLFKDFTAYENADVKRKLVLTNENKIVAMAKRLGVENKLNQSAGTCSYGEQQRIAIIRALQQPFNFIIMDEPFSHLDENNRRVAMELIEEEASIRNACIILADLKPIEFFSAERILHL